MIAATQPTRAGAQDARTADDAVRDALARPEVERLFEARLSKVRAEVEELTLWPTPTVQVSQDQVFGNVDVGYREFTASVEQRLSLSGWRSGLRDALVHREAAERSDADAWRLDAATLVKTAYYEVRYHQARLAAMDAWLQRLDQGVSALRAREAGGDASGYERRRLERELQIARVRRSAAEAALNEAWAGLEGWTAWATRPQLTAPLPPEPPRTTTDAVHPDVARLQHAELALDTELEAWGSPFWRDWTIGAGYHWAEVGQSTGQGYGIALSVPLALWNTDAPRQESLRAQRAELHSELELRMTTLEREAAAARLRLERSLAALGEMPEPNQDAELSNMAQLAYQAGELTLAELLDAYESELDLQLARLELQWEARRADIALDRAAGAGVLR